MNCFGSNSRLPVFLLVILHTFSAVHSGDVGTWDLSSNDLLPDQCGEIETPGIAGLDRTLSPLSYHWTVLLEYDTPQGKKTPCNGVLVSKRYVITVASCIRGPPKTWTLSGVRLGEFDTSTEKDCIGDQDTGLYCINDAVTIGIEEQIVHEDFTTRNRTPINDIALLRLSRDVNFTEDVGPICLPPNATPNLEKPVIVGWGTKGSSVVSDRKVEFPLKITDNERCSEIYKNRSIEIVDAQICAQALQPGQDLCRGSSGAGLMTFDRSNGRRKWNVIGLNSFGPTTCDSDVFPGVYTRVSNYVPWILSKMRA